MKKDLRDQSYRIYSSKIKILKNLFILIVVIIFIIYLNFQY